MKVSFFFFAIWFLIFSNINSVFSSEIFKLKLLDKETHKPISNAIVFCDNKIISVSDSLGFCEIQKQNNQNSKFFSIQSIDYRLKQFEFSNLNTDHENIVYLNGFQEVPAESISNIKSLEDLVLQSIENNISLNVSHHNFVADYTQFESYYVGNKLHSSKKFNESVSLKSNKHKKLIFTNKFSKNINNSLKYLLANHPVKYKDLNVIRKNTYYDYSIHSVYHNSDINSDILEVVATNKTKKDIYSETVYFTIRLQDTVLIQFHSLYSHYSSESPNIQYPNVFINYSFMQYDELFPLIISNHYKYSSRNRKNNDFEQNIYSSLFINK